MQAHVKTPRTSIHIQGEIPFRILEMLRSEYGGELKIYEGDEEYVEVTESDWYKEITEITTPGDAMRIYRKNHQLTQEQLGKKLGNVLRQIVSNMERGKRSISFATAKKLSVIFNVPASRFLDL
ncbi:MAG: helix-turn-helix transcriptional regulator [Thermodesulfobacteriota bacterium]|nr:helix-turn-helix transcriptional regulator [Thermodesulfobacteriota bacterium]